MRVLLVMTVSPVPPTDGIAIPGYELAHGLAQRHEVTVAHFGVETTSTLELAASHWSTVVLRRAARFGFSRSLATFRLLRGVPPSVMPFITEDAARLRALAQKRFDGIICQLVHTAHVVPRDTRHRSVLVAQDVVHHSIRLNSTYRQPRAFTLYDWAHARRMRAYERRMYEAFKVVAVVSDAERSRAEETAPRARVVVIPNGIDADYYDNQIPVERRDEVVYLGALNAGRHEEAAWCAAKYVMPLVRQWLSRDVVLRIVGKRPSERLIDLARKCPYTVVTGEVEDIRPSMARARVALSPQRVGTGIKNSLLIAMAMGTPCVVSTASVEGISGIDRTHYLLADGVEEAARTTVELLTDDSLAQRVSCQSRELVSERYSWDAYVSAVEQLLLER